MVSFSIIFSIQGVEKFPDPWGFFREEFGAVLFISFAFISFLVLAWTSFDGHYFLAVPLCVGLTLQFSFVTLGQLYLGSKDKGGRLVKPRITSRFHNRLVAGGANKVDHQPSSHDMSSTQRVSPVYDFREQVPQLDDILVSAASAAAFEQKVQEEYAGENLSFLQDVHVWRSSFGMATDEMNTSRARKLLKTYGEGGLLQINISQVQHERLFKNVNESRVGREAFDEARLEVAKMLEIGAVIRFREEYAGRDWMMSSSAGDGI